MPTKTLNISIPLEIEEFLKQNPELSPSKIFQAKCYAMQEQRKDWELVIQAKENALERIRLELRLMGDFIVNKKLWEEFLKWKNPPFERVPGYLLLNIFKNWIFRPIQSSTSVRLYSFFTSFRRLIILYSLGNRIEKSMFFITAFLLLCPCIRWPSALRNHSTFE